jgi:hypothetical protein
MKAHSSIDFWLNDEDKNCPIIRNEVVSGIRGIDSNLEDGSVYGVISINKIGTAEAIIEFQQYRITRSLYRMVWYQPLGFSNWERLFVNSDYYPIKETFSVISTGEAIPVLYSRQNCYKIGNKIHIEFQATTAQEMANSVPWAIVPKIYAPNTRQGSNTGSTGLFIMEINSQFYTYVCGGNVNPPSTTYNYGLVYQTISSKISANTRVQFLIEYYI